MATTPFSMAGVDYQGQGLPRDHTYTGALRKFWLGAAGNMIQLPAPSLGYDVIPTQGESVTTLMGGRTAVRFQAEEIRSWALKFPKLYGRDFEIVHGFYRRLFGNGPWCFPAPEDTNRLTAAQSLCGTLHGVAQGWTPSAGTVAYDSTLSPVVVPSGVLRWSSATSGSRLVAVASLSGGVPVPDPKTTAPYMPGMPAVGYAWVSTSTGTTTGRVRLQGVAANGSLVATINGPTVTLTTTPQMLTVITDPGYLGASVWLFLDVQCLSAGAPNILVSNALLDYRDTAPDWTVGRGVPRVVWPIAPGDSVNALFARDVTMTLAQS